MHIRDLGLVAVLAALIIWLILITVVLWRRDRLSGDVLYRRMPNGRVRFEWSAHTAYHSARRAAEQRGGPADRPASGRTAWTTPR